MDKAVFVKVDTNAQYELSSRYQVRSLPTFSFFVGGKKIQEEKGGIGEGPLRQYTDSAVRSAEIENILITPQALEDYYQTADPSKSKTDVASVYKKCADMTKRTDQCVGSAANQLMRRLRKKYGKMPPTVPRFNADDRKSSSTTSSKSETTRNKPSGSTRSSKSNDPNLHLATVEQLQEELEKRLDEIRDSQVESEDPDEDEADPDYRKWTPSQFPERVLVVGSGPAGMAAAIYAARAGLEPLVIAPSMGGQLQGKGVEVENYPGLMENTTGPGIIASMRHQAAHFGALFEDDSVVSVDASSRPFRVKTNMTGTIETHSIIVATGAEAKWLGVPGEWDLRGGGVSSCATCDGFLFSGQDVVVVGGGDAAAEDALVLARTSRTVTLVHRRDELRASKVLRDRVLNHPSITVRWNSVVKEIVGQPVEHDTSQEDEDVDLDSVQRIVSGVVLTNVETDEEIKMAVQAVFVAIGHSPATSFLKDVVEFDPEHPGYLKTAEGSTQTSVAGIFAAGDVADSVYRQAITSAGSGAAAALDAERYLSENGLGNEEAELEAELLAEMQGSASAESSYNAYDDAGGRVHGVKESMTGEL